MDNAIHGWKPGPDLWFDEYTDIPRPYSIMNDDYRAKAEDLFGYSFENVD